MAAVRILGASFRMCDTSIFDTFSRYQSEYFIPLRAEGSAGSISEGP